MSNEGCGREKQIGVKRERTRFSRPERGSSEEADKMSKMLTVFFCIALKRE
jgi:hypothetical protein